MKQRAHFSPQNATSAIRAVVFLTLIASSLAGAQAVPTIGGDASTGSKSPFRGSSISYGHAATALTFAPGAAPYWNPTESHRLGLMPEWHFSDQFFLRSRFFISQELTISDDTTYRHEVELSDLWFDLAYAGYKEKVTGIRLAGDVRVTLPTSKGSRALTRLFTVAPSINASRTFNVLSGLTFVYSTRFTLRVNQQPTAQNAGPSISSCDITNCADLFSTGRRNSFFDILHGPTVVFNPHEKLSISATFLMQRAWLPQLTPAPEVFASAEGLQIADVNTRDAMAFALGVSWQTFELVGFTLGAFTFSNQLGLDGQYQFPLFNRNTVVSLDATFDIEGVVSKFSTKEQK